MISNNIYEASVVRRGAGDARVLDYEARLADAGELARLHTC